MMISKIREIAEKEHQKEDFNYHVLVVVKNALKLAKMKKADKEVVEIAALLHDIGRAGGAKPGQLNDHHITSAKKAEKILRDLNYPEAKITKIMNCILSHRGATEDFPPKTIEEKIVANADAMAHFDTFLNLFGAFMRMGRGFEKTVEIVDAKVERDWNKKLTIPEAKKMVRKKYHAIRVVLDSMEAYTDKKRP